MHTSFPGGGGVAGSAYIYRGDPANFDFDDADLVEDNTNRVLDISAIVPVEAIAVNLSVRYLRSTSTSRRTYFFYPGQVNLKNAFVCHPAAQSSEYFAVGIVAIKDGELGYRSISNSTGACEITICGWFL